MPAFIGFMMNESLFTTRRSFLSSIGLTAPPSRAFSRELDLVNRPCWPMINPGNRSRNELYGESLQIGPKAIGRMIGNAEHNLSERVDLRFTNS